MGREILLYAFFFQSQKATIIQQDKKTNKKEFFSLCDGKMGKVLERNEVVNFILPALRSLQKGTFDISPQRNNNNNIRNM